MATANYVLLERIELNASAASVTFSNIPQSGYTDLKVVMSLRISDTQLNYGVMRINGATTNFTYRSLEGSGSAAGSYSGSVSNYGIPEISSYTANTFSNHEVYIPNYLSSSNKSFSVDAVTENNAAASYVDFVAGLWSNTAAINELSFYAPTGSFVQYSTFSLYGLAAVGTTPVIAPKASGGNITTDGTYWYHTFLTTDAFVPSQALSANALVVAGGGGGGAGQGGGGGAGGLLGFTSQSFAASTSYTVTVGAGGAGGTRSSQSNGKRGTVGSDSQLGALTLVKGGGYGGNYDDTAIGGTGGSGGGAGCGGAPPYAGGSATSGQGNAGGSVSVYNTPYAGGGGGGASAAGANGGSGNTPTGGAGSSAYSSWGLTTNTGQNVSGTVYYAGGGGGAGDLYTQVYAGGNGGGAAGTTGTPTNATANTGGGGGGSTYSSNGGQNLNNASAGGSGIVIIRYAMA